MSPGLALGFWSSSCKLQKFRAAQEIADVNYNDYIMILVMIS